MIKLVGLAANSYTQGLCTYYKDYFFSLYKLDNEPPETSSILAFSRIS